VSVLALIGGPSIPEFRAATALLLEIGIPAHLKGYRYVREAILFAASRQGNVRGLITREIYPHLARQHSSTPGRVERAIRFAIEVAWARGDVATLDSDFGSTVSKERGKPTNAEFIAMLADQLLLRQTLKCCPGASRGFSIYRKFRREA
jgi:two-component system, response regulator, stage 0 sporulation protein A